MKSFIFFPFTVCLSFRADAAQEVSLRKLSGFLCLVLATLFSLPAEEAVSQMGLRTPGDSAATSYAPVEVLNAQINALVEELTAKMAQGEAHWQENAPEVRRLASAIAVLGLVAGLHDQYCPFKDASTNITEKGNALAQVSNYAQAASAWAEFQKALVSHDSKNPSWDVQAAPMKELMRSIALYDEEIGVKVKKRRGLDAVAGRAVTMAAIFQGMTANYRDCPDPGKRLEWQEFCMKCRDSSYHLFITLEVSDRKYSPKNLETLRQNCAACHAEFNAE